MESQAKSYFTAIVHFDVLLVCESSMSSEINWLRLVFNEGPREEGEMWLCQDTAVQAPQVTVNLLIGS